MDLFGDIQKEIEYFIGDLNLTYMIIYSLVLYGIKYKEEFTWFNNLMDKNENAKPFKIWIAGIIVILFFCLFRGLEVGLSASYVSQILRSFIIVIVLNSIFSKKIKEIDK